MDSIKLLFQLYYKPGWAFSEIMDRGNWIVAAGLTLVVSVIFFAGVNARLNAAYGIPSFTDFYDPYSTSDDPEIAGPQMERSAEAYRRALTEKRAVPIVGDMLQRFFTFEPAGFYRPLLSISLFYVPAVVFLVSIFAGLASFGLLIRRDYAVIATCSLMAWAAAHFPFALFGLALTQPFRDPTIFFGLWVLSGALFGIFMLFALRTVFGVSFGVSAAVVCTAWLSLSLSMYVFQYVSPWLLSPFLLFFAFMYLGGSIGSEVRGFGNAFRQRQNLKRFLQNATVNPKDADAHVQLGLIYLQRLQNAKAIEHFEKAVSIDPDEIDANFELGKLARKSNELQRALDHFAVVLGQDDKFRLSEIWREIGATYQAAGMNSEAYVALEKFVDRRPVDPEGLYYFGVLLKEKGERDRAKEMFAAAVEAARLSPDFRRRDLRYWAKLAKKEI